MTATSGRKCLEQYGKLNQSTFWGKTLAASLIGQTGWYSTRCRLTWNLKGTTYNRLYFQLAPSTLPTDETGFGLLPTPLVNPGKRKLDKNGKNVSKAGQSFGVTLHQLADSKLLPTPRARAAGGNCSNDRNKGNLEDAIAAGKLLPTINASDHPGKNTGKRNQDSIPKRIRDMGGKTSQLNPRFVLEMMGFPPDWTELPFLSGETNPSKQRETQ
jgi:hypothetical protein